MCRYQDYTKKLDKALDELRARCLGQYTPLVSLIPQGAVLPPEGLAKGVADVLTLTLSGMADLSEKELTSAWRWLRAAVTYLLQFCPVENHVPYNLVRLSKEDATILQMLGKDHLPPELTADLTKPPACLEDLSEVVWMLTEPKMDSLRILVP